jgi:hypothetical protein
MKEPHTIQGEVRALFTKYPQVHSAAMGFPNDWQDEPIWQ